MEGGGAPESNEVVRHVYQVLFWLRHLDDRTEEGPLGPSGGQIHEGRLIEPDTIGVADEADDRPIDERGVGIRGVNDGQQTAEQPYV